MEISLAEIVYEENKAYISFETGDALITLTFTISDINKTATIFKDALTSFLITEKEKKCKKQK